MVVRGSKISEIDTNAKNKAINHTREQSVDQVSCIQLNLL